jgi:PAS domain S-box-containing protein
MSMIHPHPTGKELKLHPKDMLVSKTDVKGVISYGNNTFVEISGYKESELIGMPHNILRHPDMPKAIFYLMWESIKNGKNIMAVVKNLSKNGDHYWVTTDFDIQRNREGKIRNFIAFRQAAPKNVVKVIEPLYATMLEIEEKHSMEESINYLEAFLEEKQMSYNQYIEDLAKPKGLSAIFFSKMKKFFS